ncbi:hypothetical protein CRG98_021331 [Punica granatum]|uniref:Uncharacterized protein n=1 Tax=Punica granatum TaxID=22663 RepID=A0A2I0JPL9_PUNGR|nr:hypothetical protein CRG98_021331 [Punica granatum]
MAIFGSFEPFSRTHCQFDVRLSHGLERATNRDPSFLLTLTPCPGVSFLHSTINSIFINALISSSSMLLIGLTRDLSLQANTTVTSRGPLATVGHQPCSQKPSGATIVTFDLRFAQSGLILEILCFVQLLQGYTGQSETVRPNDHHHPLEGSLGCPKQS